MRTRIRDPKPPTHQVGLGRILSDLLTNLVNLLLIKLKALLVLNSSVPQDRLCSGLSDAVDVLKGDFNPLLRGDLDVVDTQVLNAKGNATRSSHLREIRFSYHLTAETYGP